MLVNEETLLLGLMSVSSLLMVARLVSKVPDDAVFEILNVRLMYPEY